MLGFFFNFLEGTHLVVTISSYLYLKQDNDIPTLAMELLRKISIVRIRLSELYFIQPDSSTTHEEMSCDAVLCSALLYPGFLITNTLTNAVQSRSNIPLRRFDFYTKIFFQLSPMSMYGCLGPNAKRLRDAFVSRLSSFTEVCHSLLIPELLTIQPQTKQQQQM